MIEPNSVLSTPQRKAQATEPFPLPLARSLSDASGSRQAPSYDGCQSVAGLAELFADELAALDKVLADADEPALAGRKLAWRG